MCILQCANGVPPESPLPRRVSSRRDLSHHRRMSGFQPLMHQPFGWTTSTASLADILTLPVLRQLIRNHIDDIVTLGVASSGLVIYRSEHDGLDPFLPKGSRPSSRQTTTSSATATPRLFQVEVANARATHADTPRSVGGRFADRVTPCPTPIGNGACLTTTRQASRYGDRPRPTRQPRTREWREACETLEAGGRIRAGLTPAGGRLTVCSD